LFGYRIPSRKYTMVIWSNCFSNTV
jgi:hypothetical protein